MASNLPYLASPGSIKTALERIRAAATPDRVTTDFVTTKLLIKGGTGAAIPPLLKKIGFINSDGTPTEIYKRFRNSASGGAAMAEAIKLGYRELAVVNEEFYKIGESELKALIVQVSGLESDNAVTKLIFATLNTLKAFANFKIQSSTQIISAVKEEPKEEAAAPKETGLPTETNLGLNLSYTINLNLPATSDQAVFNAIFRSLKEHLLTKNE